MSSRLLHWLPAAATAALIAYLSHQPDLPDAAEGVPDWLLHFLEYGFFTLTLLFAVTVGFDRSLRTPTRAMLAVAIASAYGVTDEWHQSFVGRHPAITDWIADTVGALVMAAIVWVVWRRMAASDPPV